MFGVSRLLATVILLSFAGVTANAEISSMWKAWHRGDIEAAAQMARQSLKRNDDEARHVLMLTSFVQGKFEDAINQQKLIRSWYPRLKETYMPVINAYRHLGRYAEAHTFAVNHGVSDPTGLQDALGQVAATPPQFNLDHTTEVAFKTADPLNPYLPAFDLKVNGSPLVGHLDTGGTFLVISKELADRIGIKYRYYAKGHCNNKDASVWFAQTELELGGIRISNIPTEISDCIDGTQMKDRAIFGTNILQHFLSTIDYPRQKLIISPYSDRAEHEHHLAKYSHIQRQKFNIWSDHYMFTKGQISGSKNLNFFVDTGLVDFHSDGRQAAFFTSTDTLMKLGYPESALSKADVVDIRAELGLKNLVQSGHVVKHQEELAFGDFGGVEISGLIAHAFLHKYAWTIDFERMTYSFGH